jgi:site-specific DNA-methyltransferase (cytosine-N4-specific)
MYTNYQGYGDWDFRGANTKEYTHCFHIYPAMMIPQVARGLIQLYGSKEDLLFDPYCGSGTSLVEARVAGLNAVGTDINPTARLISEAKTRDYNALKLEKEAHEYLNRLEKALSDVEDYSTFDEHPSISWNDLEKWFPKKTIGHLLTALHEISGVKYKAAHLFLKASLSECLRLVSYQRNGEFKLYRIEENKREEYYEPLLPLLTKRINRNLNGVRDFLEKASKNTNAKIRDFNTVHTSGRSKLPGSGAAIDLVVTSPPYGDSGTTVAYSQFSWLTNVWFSMDVRSPGVLDAEMMGGKRTQINVLDFFELLSCEPLNSAFEQIHQVDRERAGEIMQFYYDYFLSIKNVAKEVKTGGHACYVVGNRTVCEVQLPTDQFTAWAFEQNGFEYVTTYLRDIPNKRMPGKNSPTNKAGKKVETMHKEYLVVLKKL